MLTFLKKDLKLIVRDPVELLLLLGMPLVLIAILGFALGNLLGTGSGTVADTSPVHIEAGLVVEDDISQGRAAFREALSASDRQALEQAGLLLGSQSFDPLDIMREFLLDEGLQELLTVTQLSAIEADAQLASGDLHAVITVPQGFSAALYSRMLLDEGDSAAVLVQLSDDAPLRASIVRDLLQGFAAEFSTQTALQQLASERGEIPSLQGSDVPLVTGSIERLSGDQREVTSFAYYAFGMAVMFMLYLVGNSGTRAYLELANFSFDRIIISNARPVNFLVSKAVAAAIVGFAQIMILIIITNLLFGALRGQPLEFWLQATAIAAMAALTVGALAALVTAVVVRTSNKGIADAFNSVIVFVFALLGGSFVPLGDGLFAQLGEWTPNGAALKALLDAARGLDASTWGFGMFKLAVMAVICLLLALLIFPRARTA